MTKQSTRSWATRSSSIRGTSWYFPTSQDKCLKTLNFTIGLQKMGKSSAIIVVRSNLMLEQSIARYAWTKQVTVQTGLNCPWRTRRPWRGKSLKILELPLLPGLEQSRYKQRKALCHSRITVARMNSKKLKPSFQDRQYPDLARDRLPYNSNHFTLQSEISVMEQAIWRDLAFKGKWRKDESFNPLQFTQIIATDSCQS